MQDQAPRHHVGYLVTNLVTVWPSNGRGEYVEVAPRKGHFRVTAVHTERGSIEVKFLGLAGEHPWPQALTLTSMSATAFASVEPDDLSDGLLREIIAIANEARGTTTLNRREALGRIAEIAAGAKA